MKRVGIALITLMCMSLLFPLSSAAFLNFTTGDSIRVLAGDYSTGRLTVTNPTSFDFKIVSLRNYWVTDRYGHEVSGFNVTITPRNIGSWKSRASRDLYYNVTCPSNMTAGDYRLHLRFLGSTSKGDLDIITMEVPIYVTASPFVFQFVQAYVVGKSGSPSALNGDKIAVIAQIDNIGHKTLSVKTLLKFSLDGKVYLNKSATLSVPPGSHVFTTEFQIPYSWPEGTYLLTCTVIYRNETRIYSKYFSIHFGVNVVGTSLKSDRVEFGHSDTLYVTVVSERNAVLDFEYKAYAGGKLVGTLKKSAEVTPGTNVISIPLLTNATGTITSKVTVSSMGRRISSFEVKYLVVAPPKLVNVSFVRISGGSGKFIVGMMNPNSWAVNATLSYRITADGAVIYKNSMPVVVRPGKSEVPIEVKLPVNKTIGYEFSLQAMGGESSFHGHFYLTLPQTSTSSTQTHTTPSKTSWSVSATTSTSGGGGSYAKVLALLLAAIIAVGLVVFYFSRKEEPKRKRKRPKPKRKSPLGKYKKPKEPRFKEHRSLPKK